MKSCFFLSAALLLSAAALPAQDVTAPQVTSISIPGPVDVESGPANVTVTLGIPDADGFQFGYLTLYRPDDGHVKNVTFTSTARTDVGKYEIPVEIPGYGTGGTWRFEAYVSDAANNSRRYGTGPGEEPFPVPADATFTVTNSGTPDTSGPVPTNVDFSPTNGDVSNAPLTITATFDAADTPSGFDYATIYVKDPNGNYQSDFFGSIDAAQRISGDEFDGSYEGSATIPRGSMAGEWEVYLGMRDQLGNYVFTPNIPITVTSSGGATGGLADACDATQYPWTTRGDADWTFQTATTHDGIDAARSGPIGDNGESVMEVEVTGPGILSFWWKVSSASGDTLLVSAAGPDNSFGISGQSAWAQRSLTIEPGLQTVTWMYSKNSAGSAGDDAGWVDQVYFAAEEDTEAPVLQYLNISPNPASVANGDVDVNVTFEVSDEYSGVTGGEVILSGPNDYGMSARFNSSDRLPDGDEFFGTYRVTFTILQSDVDPDYGDFSLGLWHAQITVEDDYSNARTYGPYDDAFPVPGTDEFTVTDAPVGGSLAIASIDLLDPDPVDVTGGTQTLTVNFTVDDPGGVFGYGNVFLRRADDEFVDSYFFDASNGSGGQYSVPVKIPQYGQPGAWRVSFLLVDQDEHNTDVDGWIQNPGDDKFTVINTGSVDSTPAVVSSIVITPKVIDTSAGTANIAVTVGISDDLSGLATIFVNFIDPSGNESFYAFVDGATITGGSFTVNRALPQGSAEGVWRCSVSVRDQAGNYRRYGPSGSETPFPVPANAQFTVGAVTGSSFASFAAAYSLTGNDALLGANPDHDWASNALEFLLGLDPTLATAVDPALYHFSRSGNEIHLDFKPAAALSITNDGDFLKVANAAGDAPVRVTGQTATALAGPWTNVRPQAVGGGIYRLVLPIGPGGGGFCRLVFQEP